MLAKSCVFMSIFILVFLSVRMTYRIDGSKMLENFAVPADIIGTPNTITEYVTVPRLNLMITPLIVGMNAVIDAVNEIPNKLYSNSVGASKKIKTKIKEYAETMTGYNRTADDTDGLKNVTINKKHKIYIDSLPATSFAYLTTVADKFYIAPFDNHEPLIQAILLQMSGSNESLALALKTTTISV